ncbi:MAG TPA: hypothetical protein VGA19_08070, partial [Rhodospirillales bacterium]
MAATLALAAWAGASLAQQAPAQQAQAAAGRAIVGEWSFLCNAPQRLGFAEDPAGKLSRYYVREGIYRTEVESVTGYAEEADLIKIKFASGEELTYKRSPEGIREWYRRVPPWDAATRNGKMESPVLKTFL